MTITNEQREARKSGIFSSDCPRIMAGDGVRVALEKLGELERENLDDVPEIQLGNIVESKILDVFEAQEAVPLRRSLDTMRHAEHHWLGAHLDAIADDGVIVEAKSVGWYNREQWGSPGSDEVPDRVLWQVQEQLAVARLPLAKVPVCFINEKALVALATGRPLPIEVYVIPADRDLEAYIVERCGKVWRHVESRTLPEAEKPMDARLIYRKDSGAVIEADDDTLQLCLSLQAAKAAKAAAEKREKELAAQVQAFMKDASELRRNGQTLATWKLNAGRKSYTVRASEPYRAFLPKEIA